MRLLSHSGIRVFFGVMALACLAGCRPTVPLCRHQECALHEDCPPDRPVCQDIRCVRECETEADCAGRGKLDLVCRDFHCQRECEKDSDCERAMECKNTHCIPRCQCQSDQDCLEGKSCQNCVCAGTGA